jgi:hypothetical protein
MSVFTALVSVPVLAESEISANTQTLKEMNEISPYDLVTGSYQGRFSDQGIPSANRFVYNVRANKIKAKDLVEVAIAEGRLPESSLNDKAYLHNVKSIMDTLDRN